MSDNLKHKPNIKKANACPPLPANAGLLDKVVYWLGIGLGSGMPKKAPGTWGTVGGMLVAIPLMMLGFIPFLVITIVSSIVGIWICGRTSELMGVHDDPHIVFDEWAGIWITMLPISYMIQTFCSKGSQTIGNITVAPADYSYLAIMMLASFLLFRFFDILKPFPISYCDKHLSGGLGIMLDDILAGLAVLGIYVSLSYITIAI